MHINYGEMKERSVRENAKLELKHFRAPVLYIKLIRQCTASTRGFIVHSEWLLLQTLSINIMQRSVLSDFTACFTYLSFPSVLFSFCYSYFACICVFFLSFPRMVFFSFWDAVVFLFYACSCLWILFCVILGLILPVVFVKDHDVFLVHVSGLMNLSPSNTGSTYSLSFRDSYWTEPFLTLCYSPLLTSRPNLSISPALNLSNPFYHLRS